MLKRLSGLIFGVLLSVTGTATAQTSDPYDGTQDLRPTFMGTAYDVTGGDFDGKRGFLFRIWNREGTPIELSSIPDQFNQPILGFLSVGAEYTNGVASFEGRTTPNEELFQAGAETLNPSPTGAFADRPANFIAIVEPSVNTLVFTLRGRTATGSYAAATIETLDLDGGGQTFNTQINFIYDEGDFDGSDTATYAIDGVEVGVIPVSGTVQAQLAPGVRTVTAINQTAAGSATLEVSATGMNQIDVRMQGDALVGVLEYELRLPNEPDATIDPTAFDLTLGFFDPGGTAIPILDEPAIYAYRIEPGSFRDGYGRAIGRNISLDSEFTVQPNGLLQATSPQNVISQILEMGPGPYMFEIYATDPSTELPLHAAIEFDIARHSLNGTILKLPDSPSYNFTDIVVQASSSDTGIPVTTSVDSSGAFDFGLLPEGPYRLEVLLQVGNEFISSLGDIVLDQNTTVEMTPITVAQAIAEVEFFSVTSGVNLNSLQNSSSNFRSSSRNGSLARLRQSSEVSWPTRDLFLNGRVIDLSASSGVTLNSPVISQRQQVPPGSTTFRVGAGAGDRVTETFQIEIPGDQTELGIAYQVSLFVGVQSGGGGSRWSVIVRDDTGLPLFSDGSSFSAGATRAGASLNRVDDFTTETDIIGDTLDVIPLSDPNTDRIIYVTISVRSDDINETAGDVTFSFVDQPFIVAQPEPQIELEIVRSAIPRSDARGCCRGARTRQLINGDVVSIPDDGDTNFYEFRLPITITRVDTGDTLSASDITSASLELEYVGANGNNSVEIFNDSTAQVSDGSGDELEVQAAFIDPTGASSTDTSPPISDNVQHKVSFTAMVDGQTLDAELQFGELIGLYESGTDVVRTTGGEPGGDKWTHKRVRDWLVANGGLINIVNDISGEHGVDIGHLSHTQGLDLDMRFFDDDRAGSTVYQELTNNVLSAARGNAGALADVQNFVSDQQDGLEALEASGVFDRLIGPVGQTTTETNPPPGLEPIVLPFGWAEELFEDGTVTGSDGTVVIDINDAMNAATAAIYRGLRGHDDHYHIDFVLADLP